MRDNGSKNVYDLTTGKKLEAGRPPVKETVRKPTEGVYLLLTEALKPENTDSEELHDVLNDVYKELAQTDPDLLTAVNRLEDEGAISRKDSLYLVVLFTVGQSIGPAELKPIRDLLVAVFPPADRLTRVEEHITRVPLSETIKKYLSEVANKICKND